MFETLTETEARQLDAQLFMAERALKGRISDLAIRRRTKTIERRMMIYAGMVGEVYGLRDSLDPLIGLLPRITD